MANPTVNFNGVTAFFAGTQVTLSGPISIQLIDGVTAQGGDGNFEVVLALNELVTFGSGTNGPALHCIAGSMPYDPNVHRLAQFTVIGNSELPANPRLCGTRDLRIMGGVGTDNVIPGSLDLNLNGDVLITSPTNGQVLTYNSTDHKWENENPSVGATTLETLTDVLISGVTNGQTIEWNSGAGKWENATPITTLDSLTNVTLSGLANGQVLYYNSGASKWENETMNIETLGDVLVTSIADTQVLAWDAASSKWKNVNQSGGGVTTLAALTDVSLTSPSSGQVLYYNSGASKWENETLNIETLADVLVTSVADGQVLAWNAASSKWKNVNQSGGVTTLAALTDVSLTSPSSGQVLYYNSGASKWENETLNLETLADVSMSSVQTGQVPVWNGTAWVNAASQAYPVTSLPLASSTYRGQFFLLKSSGAGVPDAVYVCREREDGTYVWTRFQGRSFRMKMSSADFTPSSTGVDLGGLAIVPFDPDEPGQISIAWTVVDIVFRMETTAASGTTSVKIQRSTGTGIFSNAGYLNTTAVSISSGSYEQSTKPASLAVTTVNSGDKLLPEYTAIGPSSGGYTLYVVLRES